MLVHLGLCFVLWSVSFRRAFPAAGPSFPSAMFGTAGPLPARPRSLLSVSRTHARCITDLDYDMRGNFEGSAMEISASTTEPAGVRRAFEIAHLIMSGLRLEQVGETGGGEG